MSTPAALIRPGGAPAAPANKWLVTVSITFGTLMGAIDSSIVNVALPHIRGAVGATLQEITWISTGYAVALVLVMPLTPSWAACSDRSASTCSVSACSSPGRSCAARRRR